MSTDTVIGYLFTWIAYAEINETKTKQTEKERGKKADVFKSAMPS